MGEAARYVFRSTRDAHRQLTQLFDFIHPTAIAMWNLRWQVRGYMECVERPSHQDIEARFARGSKISAGSIKKSTVDTTWEAQLQQFASIILINTIAIFEDFTANMAALIYTDRTRRRRMADAMQFPASQANKDRPDPLRLVGQQLSPFSGAVTWDKAVLRRLDLNAQHDLLLCYRLFKEIKNAIAHNGGRANNSTKEAYERFSAVIVNGKVGATNAPDHTSINSVGDEVKITYRGIVGFSEIVFAILTNYDVVFSEYEIAEKELPYHVLPDLRAWPTSQASVNRRIEKMFTSNDFPSIKVTDNLKAYLIRMGYIPNYVK